MSSANESDPKSALPQAPPATIVGVKDGSIYATGWWKQSVVYQIYPRSFCDSNDDGIGDLRGIISKVDYLKQLGIDVVWLSPIYKSPNDDNGYDISDYQAIMDEFGTLADFDELLVELHHRGIKLVMDLVVNHTSDEHPWFIESRKSKDNPYRNFYIWRPGRDDHEPNNWGSLFGGSAWKFDAPTDEFFLHLFSPRQPDLNWENPKVRAAIYEMMNWWLQRGIDGFRMDVINMISKVPDLPNVTGGGAGRYQFGGKYFIHGPRLLDFLQEMKKAVLSRNDVITVGEMPTVSTEQAVRITHNETGFLSMVFHFDHMDLDTDPKGSSKWDLRPWNLADLKRVMTHWQKDLEETGWNSLYLSNHDQPRALSRFGDDGQYRVQSAKLLATFLHMLRGTPYIYQGEEIGMTNVQFESISDYRDIETLNIYWELTEIKKMDVSAVMEKIHAKSRDNARTPMQWDASASAGFTGGKPWIGVNPNYRKINVQQAIADPDSIFAYYQKLISLRKTTPVMVHGKYGLLLESHPQIYAFSRTWLDEQLVVVLNFTKNSATFNPPDHLTFKKASLLIGNYAIDPLTEIPARVLRPYEAIVYRLPR